MNTGSNYTRLLLSALVALPAGGCAESPVEPPLASPVDPPEAPARVATMAMVSGDAQPGLAGAPLAEPLVVRVSDERGEALRGLAVSWRIVTGAGALLPPIDCGSATTITTRTGRQGITQAWFAPSVLGPSSVAATLRWSEETVRTVIFRAEVTGLLISLVTGPGGWFGECKDPLGFQPPVARVPVGATVGWAGVHPGLHVVSTSTPPAGASFDSGPLHAGDRFLFVPEVTGVWEYVDLVSGNTGAVTVVPRGSE